MLVAVLCAGVSAAWGQESTTLFLETFGSASNNTAMGSYSGYSATSNMFNTNGNHYSGSGIVGKSNLSAANLSNGYEGASGESGIYHVGTANTEAVIIQIEGIKIEGYENLSLSFGALGGSSSHKVNVSYKIDGGEEKSLIEDGAITNAKWTLLTASIPDTGSSLTLIFKHTPSKAWTIRMDDIKVTGTAITSGKTIPSIEVEGYRELLRFGTYQDLTITTNSDSPIQAEILNNSNVIYTRDFSQENGVATVNIRPNLSNLVGQAQYRIYVEESEVYAAAERILTFNVRKSYTQTEIDATGIMNTDIASGPAAGSLLANMLWEQEDGSYKFYLNSNHPDNLFTWSSSDENVATVASDGTVTLVGAGTTTITANFNGTNLFEASSATYELTVTDSNGPVIGTATFNFPEMGYANQAEVTTATKDGVTVTFDKGTNSYAPKYYTSGTAVRAYGGNTFTISSDNIIKKIVITFGESDGSNSITTDVNTYENGTWTGSANSVTFTIGGTSGNRRIQTITVTYEEADQTISVAPQISGEESFLNETTVTITAAEGAAIYYTTDGTDPTTSTPYSAPFTLNATTTVKAIAVESGKEASVVAEKTFTKQTVMTVAEALTLIEDLEENESSDFVYVKGVVTKVESYSDNYHSITYSIADEGTTTPELKVFGGKNLNNTDFSSMDDLGVNDVVTIYGKLKEYDSTPEFDSNNYIVAIERSKQPAELRYATTTITKQVGDEPFTNELTNPHSLAVTYSSNDEAVATVDADGVVTILAAGSAIITAYFEGNDTYNEGSASYSLTVSNGEKAVFKKVTSTDDITDGEYLIVYEEGSLAFDGSRATLDAVSNTIGVVIDNGSIEALTANAFTLSSMTGGYSIKSASGNYIGQTSDANGMATSDDAIANAISFDDNGNANIVSGGAYLRYNSASNQLRFRYYKSTSYTGQKAIQLYKKVETVTASITAAGYATFANAKAVDFTGTGVKVMTAQYANGKITYTEVTSKQVPAGAAVILQGSKGTYNATVIESAEELQNNSLEVNLNDDIKSDGYYYCLANKSNGVGFYKVASGVNVKKGKAYLHITAGAKDFFSINDETDGIGQIEMVQTSNAEIYNLSGQRVSKAQKGIYIVNGKKVVIR